MANVGIFNKLFGSFSDASVKSPEGEIVKLGKNVNLNPSGALKLVLAELVGGLRHHVGTLSDKVMSLDVTEKISDSKNSLLNEAGEIMAIKLNFIDTSERVYNGDVLAEQEVKKSVLSLSVIQKVVDHGLALFRISKDLCSFLKANGESDVAKRADEEIQSVVGKAAKTQQIIFEAVVDSHATTDVRSLEKRTSEAIALLIENYKKIERNMAYDIMTGGVSSSLAKKGHRLSKESIEANYDQLFHHQKMSILSEMQRLARLKVEEVPRSFNDAWIA